MSNRTSETTKPDPLDVTDFRFRSDNCHNRDMLEYRAEKAHLAGAMDLAAQFSIAAAIYGLLAAHCDERIPE